MSAYNKTTMQSSSPNSRFSSSSSASNLRSTSTNGGVRKGSEDLYVKNKYRKQIEKQIETMQNSTTKRNGPLSPKSPTSYSFGTKDPLSYGTRLSSSSGTGSTLPKYDQRGSKDQEVLRQTGNEQKIFSGGLQVAKKITPGGADSLDKKKQTGVQDYETLKKKCLTAHVLFEDEVFPAHDSSIFYSEAGKKRLIWKRPKEISKNPKFFVDGASRFDVKQGRLGNCWFLAAVGNLTIHEDMFYQVVPRDNTFDVDYCGIFHFRFWQYGTWVEVCIDDRLPCDPVNGELVFMHSYKANEFWSALIEKAYAKIHGSYEALESGNANEALQDFSGGIVEAVRIKDPDVDIARIIEIAFKRQSFLCAGINAIPGRKEGITPDGLVHGHAYTITCFKRFEIKGMQSVPLIRIRNPWGSEKEWNGAWSDGSKEWSLVSDEEKTSVKLRKRSDGEFWMSCDDFKVKFDTLEICNLSPSLYHGVITEGRKWNESDYNGKWVKYASAGGCGNYIYTEPATFANNPQFIVEFDNPDEDGDPNKCTVLIGLVQKNRRSKRKEGAVSLNIGYSIYALDDKKKLPSPLDSDFFKSHTPVGRSGKFSNSRVVNARFELAPGKYCIVPCTFDPDQEGEFVIRVFSEASNRIKENGGVTKLDEDSESDSEDDEDTKPKKPSPKLTRDQIAKNDAIEKLFDATAGAEQEIGWFKLKQLLDNYLKKEFKFNGFGGETCRSLVALLDKDRSGKIGLSEFQELWTSLLRWKNAFKKFDENHSNTMCSRELRNALKSIGIIVSTRTLDTLVLRYGNDTGEISFEDFIMCTVKLNAMITTFKEVSADKGKSASFQLEDWLEKTIYT